MEHVALPSPSSGLHDQRESTVVASPSCAREESKTRLRRVNYQVATPGRRARGSLVKLPTQSNSMPPASLQRVSFCTGAPTSLRRASGSSPSPFKSKMLNVGVYP